MKIESYEITGKGGRKNRYAGSVSGKGGVMEALGVQKRSKKRERGKEKTRLLQHDLQIALSPWRLLSALFFDPK